MLLCIIRFQYYVGFYICAYMCLGVYVHIHICMICKTVKEKNYDKIVNNLNWKIHFKGNVVPFQ